MQAGAAAERQQKYAEALLAYREAQRLVPTDAKAAAAVRFTQHMADGQRLLAARRFPDAVKEFDEALQLSPGHPDATQFLKRAREGRP